MITKLISVDGHGFLSFLNHFVFRMDGLRGKTIQIDGINKDDPLSESNGSGKSSLLETICWGLFGELARNNKYADEVIHNDIDKCGVSVLLEINKKEFLITRTKKRNESPKIELSSIIQLHKDSTSKIIQGEINKLLGFDYTTFLCSTMFSQGFISFAELKPARRSELLADINNLYKWEKRSDKAKEEISQIKEKIFGHEVQLSNLTGAIKAIDIRKLRASKKEFLRIRNLKLNELYFNLENLEEDRHRIEEEEKEKLVEEINELKNRIIRIKANIPKKYWIERYENGLNRLKELEGRYYTLMGQERIIKKQISTMEKLGDVCPICRRPLSAIHIKAEIGRLKKELTVINNKADGFSKSISNMEIKVDLCKKKVNMRKESLVTIDSIKEKISLAKKITKSQSLLEIEWSIDETKRKIESIKEEKNPYTQLLEEEKKKKARYINERSNTREEVKRLRDKMEYYEFWKIGFKKIQISQFNSMLSLFEFEANQFLSRYTKEYKLEFSTEKELKSGDIRREVNIRIYNLDGESMSYEMYSGGERQKINLSISMALAKIIQEKAGKEFNFVAFDEPNTGLDDIGKKINFSIFQDLAKEGKTVLVTDHDAYFKDLFDSNITIVKEEGGSIIK